MFKVDQYVACDGVAAQIVHVIPGDTTDGYEHTTTYRVRIFNSAGRDQFKTVQESRLVCWTEAKRNATKSA